MSTPSIPTVCDLSGFTAEERDRLQELGRSAVGLAAEVHERSDGYGLRYPDASAELLLGLAEFIALDRRCCAFVGHAVVSEPATGTVWLELTAPAGAAAAIDAEVLRFVPTSVPRS